MLIATEAREGERFYAKFTNTADADGRESAINSWGTEECSEGAGPHAVRIPIPADAPLDDYQLTALSLVRGEDALVRFPSDDLSNIWLTVGEPNSPLTSDAILRFNRPA
jgi:hypothetical protein